MTTPEDLARQEIDRLLTQAGWVVCNPDDANIVAHRGVAIRAFPLKTGHGYADYLLYVDGRAAGVIEAKKTGTEVNFTPPTTTEFAGSVAKDMVGGFTKVPELRLILYILPVVAILIILALVLSK